MDNATCKVRKCPEPVEARGWCRTHYQRWYRHGDPLALMQPPETAGIYRISGPDGKAYIGSAENLRRRWTDHKKRLRRHEHHNFLLQADWDDHGEAAFTFAVLEEVPDPLLLLAAEQRCLDAAKEDGEAVYNIAVDVTSPGRGLAHTDAAKAKMSAKAKAWLADAVNVEKVRERTQGDGNPMAKLEALDVVEICERLINGTHPKVLAEEFGVVQETIYQIRSGRIWAHIVPPEVVAAMMAVRQNPWADGTRIVTDDMRERFATVGRANKGKSPSAERRDQVSRQSRGSGNPKAKLTDDDVREIRRLAAAGSRNIDLAERFGIHPNSVSKIKSGETWAHVT